MNNRKRMIELIQEAVGGCSHHWAALIASNLLVNGVDFVEHGAWENIKDFGNGNCFGYCSVCGTDHKATGIADLMFSFKYCRWCGAKMDGGANG